MFGLTKKTPDEATQRVRQALGPDVAVVLSACCCMAGTAAADGQVEAVARAALKEAGLDWPVLTITVTEAQGALARIGRELGPAEAQLAQQVSELFATKGLGAFPVLLIDQRVLAYGGVPGLPLVLSALASRQDTRAGHANAA